MAPAVSSTTFSASQPAEKSATYGRRYVSWPAAWATAKASAASFWYCWKRARPCGPSSRCSFFRLGNAVARSWNRMEALM